MLQVEVSELQAGELDPQPVAAGAGANRMLGHSNAGVLVQGSAAETEAPWDAEAHPSGSGALGGVAVPGANLNDGKTVSPSANSTATFSFGSKASPSVAAASSVSASTQAEAGTSYVEATNSSSTANESSFPTGAAVQESLASLQQVHDQRPLNEDRPAGDDSNLFVGDLAR